MSAQADRPCGVLAYEHLKVVELAIALGNRPRVLLMDEPTAGMAPRERVALMGLAARLAHERRVAVLFTEHDRDIVFSHPDRIIVLSRGELIAEGKAAAIRSEERSVGEGGVSTCRSRGAAYHLKKKQIIKD